MNEFGRGNETVRKMNSSEKYQKIKKKNYMKELDI